LIFAKSVAKIFIPKGLTRVEPYGDKNYRGLNYKKKLYRRNKLDCLSLLVPPILVKFLRARVGAYP
jgi:hypothetical protein